MELNTFVEEKLENFPCEFIEMDSINPFVSKVKIKVCYVSDDPNPNGTIINKEVGKEMAKTLPGCPIVGHYINEKKDFGGHDKIFAMSGNEWVLSDNTQPYGFIDINPKVWFQMETDNKGIQKEYLCTEGYIWTGQYEEAQRIIEHGNPQSMEIDSDTAEGDWQFNEKTGVEFFIFNKAILSKLCILGNDVQPCFEDASITSIDFSLGQSFKNKFYTLMSQIQYALEKGESGLDNNLETQVTSTVTDPANSSAESQTSTSTSTTVNTPVVNLDTDGQEVQIKNLNETIVKLSNENLELKNKISEMEKEYSLVQNENKELLEFKKQAEKRDKQAMIDKFSMLADEDKLDVISHIDEYSLDDIESKLSVICVRKRVDFSALENINQDAAQNQSVTTNCQSIPSVTYSLNNYRDTNSNVPAWVQAAIEVTKEIN